MRICNLAVGIMFAVIMIIAKDKIIYETFFTPSDFRENNITEGTYSITDEGLTLNGDSRIKLKFPESKRVKNGTLKLTFVSPKIDKSLIPIITSSKDPLRTSITN